MSPEKHSGSRGITDPEVRAPRRDLIAFTIPFLIALGVYVFSLPPSITLEDAGELVVAADHLGVPHPPGYPLWTLLAWFFQWIFGFVTYMGYPNPAWPVALMSAVFGALTCGLIAVCTARLIRSFGSAVPDASAPGRPALLPIGMGAGSALTLCALIQISPGVGTLGIKGLGTLFLLVLILQGFGPAERLKGLNGRLPSLARLGYGVTGFLMTVISYLALWSLVRIPSVGLLIPLTALTIAIYLPVAFILHSGVTKAMAHPTLPSDLIRSGTDILLGIASGLLLAFTPLMYSQSVIAEVYSLNAFFAALLLLLILAYIQRPSTKLILSIGFIFALGLTNHQSLLFLVFFLIAGVAAARQKLLLKDGLFLLGLGALVYCAVNVIHLNGLGSSSAGFLIGAFWISLMMTGLALTQGRLFTTWRTLIGLLLLGILGLSLHLYMPIASSQNPPMNWGNTQTWEGFRHSLTRGQYANFDVGDNIAILKDSLATPVDPAWTEEQIDLSQNRRTLFIDMLGAFLFNPDWKTSMASQFSLQVPLADSDPTGTLPPPEQRTFPLALLGLLPLLMCTAFPQKTRGWFISSIIAMFFITVVFLLIQWPTLSHHDLWVKRVQYIPAHTLFACWMGLGAGLAALLIYSILPKRQMLYAISLPVCALFIIVPLWKEANDPQHLEHLGASSNRHQDFGWQLGFYMLRGANGILLDELLRQDNPPAQLTPWATRMLQRQGFDAETLDLLLSKAGDQPQPLSEFRKSVFSLFRGSEAEKKRLEEAAMMGAFRAMSPEEQTASLVHLHRPLPDWDYPAEMTPDAIFFGGTDPGRFIPTYMVYSAKVRPDISVLTQTALADSTYQDTTRNFYGDEFIMPDFLDANQAFLDYADQLRLFYPDQFAGVMGTGDRMAVSGMTEVNRINARMARQLLERNSAAHDFYLEEAVRMPWMIRHLRPNGLIFKLEPDPLDLTRQELKQNHAFWDWMEEHLKVSAKGIHRNPYQRNLQVRKTFSKLRMAQAWNFHERGLPGDAQRAIDQALRFYPANPEATYRAAEMYMQRGDFDKVDAVIATFEQHNPTHPQLQTFKLSMATLRDLDIRRLDLEKRLRMRSSGNTALQLLQIYDSLGRQEQSVAMAELILSLPNLHADFYPNLARMMQRQENRELYKRAIQTWTQKAPEVFLGWVDLAVLALEEENYSEMMQHLVRAVQADPENARQHIARDPRFIDIHHWQQFQQLLGTE